MINRRGAVWLLVVKNQVSLAIGFALVASAFTLGAAAGATNPTDQAVVTLSLSLDSILRYVVQPLILLLLAVLGWFMRNAYASIQDDQRKTHDSLESLNTRMSYLEGALSTNTSKGASDGPKAWL